MKHTVKIVALCCMAVMLWGCVGRNATMASVPNLPAQPLAIVAQPTPVQIPTQAEILQQGTGVSQRFFLPSVIRSYPMVVLPPEKRVLEGGVSLPEASKSYYMMTVDPSANFNLGCELGLSDLNTPGIQDHLVILDYGSPKQVNDVQGASLLMLSGFASTQQIALAVENYGWGYYVCTGEDMQSHLRIAIGTTNYPTSTNPSVTYQHGLAWANLVNEVNSWLSVKARNTITQQVDAVGANDIELSWNYYDSTRQWLDGYDAANGYELYNFGALPGCPYFEKPGSTCGSYPYIWSKEQVWHVIYGAGPVYALPEIYARNGVNAQQWYLMSVYAAVTHGVPVGFVGTLSTYSACLQEGGCGTGNGAINNTPQQSWTQLYTLLNGDLRTVHGLRWASDMVWTNSSGVVYGLNAAPQDETAAEVLLPEEKDWLLQQALQQNLQSQDLSPEARSSLEEKLSLASRVALPVEAAFEPASKEFPAQLAQAALASSLPVDVSDRIVEGSEGLVQPSQADIANLWAGMVDDAYLQVLAGSFTDDPQQGVVIVIGLTNNALFPERQVLYAPSYTGQMRIIERQDDQLIIQALNGQRLRFNLITRTLQ